MFVKKSAMCLNNQEMQVASLNNLILWVDQNIVVSSNGNQKNKDLKDHHILVLTQHGNRMTALIRGILVFLKMVQEKVDYIISTYDFYHILQKEST